MWALLPLKPFDEAKQRLAGALAQAERAALAGAMAEDVLAALTRNKRLERVVVMSRGAEAESLARRCGAEFMPEPRLTRYGLNPAVGRSVELLAAQGARSLLVVHGDLPLLGEDDLAALLDAHAAGGERAATLMPDRARDGTNLLAWTPVGEFRPQYGKASFRRHSEQAIRAGARLAICESPTGGLDIDLPDDLCSLLAKRDSSRARATRRFLCTSGIAQRIERERTAA
jgi:2-phospho-L-lactate guanylyltransferase